MPPPVGTTYLYEEDGTFEVPATGNYQVELHGGGGYPYVNSDGSIIFSVATGGGSGEIFNLYLTSGEKYDITLGTGATNIWQSTGGSSSFGNYAIAGGGGASSSSSGAASGSIATNGVYIENPYDGFYNGGYGNINNTSQIYGNGGGATISNYESFYQKGNNGACIITYMGK